MEKKLYRVEQGKMLCGLCAGLAEYLNLDVTIVRLIAAVIGLSGSGILLYIVAALIMPVKPRQIES